jgi:hypothetical protein
MDLDLARWGAIEQLILEGMQRLQQAHLIMNHIKAEHGLITKSANVEPECDE